LLAEWRQASLAQDSGLSDLLAQGSIDAVVEPDDLPGELDRFLGCRTPARRRSTPHLVLAQ